METVSVRDDPPHVHRKFDDAYWEPIKALWKRHEREYTVIAKLWHEENEPLSIIQNPWITEEMVERMNMKLSKIGLALRPIRWKNKALLPWAEQAIQLQKLE